MKYHRYHINTKNTPLEDLLIFKTVVNRSEICINCGICQTACPYDVHERNANFRAVGVHEQEAGIATKGWSWFDMPKMASPKNANCTTCFHCVNECPVGALSLSSNPDYKTHGDDYYTPGTIETVLFESKTGRVPVSGAGYRGPFAGEGFDGIWTDMSEIVRPTRDGIHGRESISTAVMIGRKPKKILPGSSQNAAAAVELGLPLVFNEPPAFAARDKNLSQSLLRAAEDIQTLALLDADDAQEKSSPHAVACFKNSSLSWKGPEAPKICQIDLSAQKMNDWPACWEKTKATWPQTMVMVKIALENAAIPQIVRLAEMGAEIFHLSASPRAKTTDGLHLTQALRTADEALIEAGLRDEVTLVASGGLTAAEHLAKSILCGADVIAIDVAYLIALGVTRFKTDGAGIEIEGPAIFPAPHIAVQRLKNLAGSWRDQLLEILGAMGMRDVQRMTGDTGRMMLNEELEKEFKALFKPMRKQDDPNYG